MVRVKPASHVCGGGSDARRINPRFGIAAMLTTQRYSGFGNPYAYEFHRHAYKALGH